MARIGLTGGVATGKSTVLGYIREAGVPVDSADEHVRNAWSDPAFAAKVAGLLGLEEPIDRSMVRESISADPAARRKLNDLLHGRVLTEMLDGPGVVLEIPLLVEACSQRYFDEIWVVHCEPEAQLERLTARLGDAEAARRLIATQLPLEVKLAFADREIRTDPDPQNVRTATLNTLRQAKLLPVAG